MCLTHQCYRTMIVLTTKMKKLLSLAVILLCAQGTVPAHGFTGFAYSDTVEEAEGAGNAQRWLLCLMLSKGLITPEEADEAVSLVSQFNQQLFNQYTEEYGSPRYNAYDFAWRSASVATNEYDRQCKTIKRPRPVYPDPMNGF